jgi:signal transduction histidine kinase
VASIRDRPHALAGGGGHDPVEARKASQGPAVSGGLARPRSARVRYVLELVALGLAYFVFAKIGLALASIHPSATPIWPPTGLAIAAVMLRGYRVWPAIFLGAWLANATTAGTVYTSSTIALGNTLECLVAGYLVGRWSNGVGTFATPAGVAKFALIVLLAATPISATIGVGSLALAGQADPSTVASAWLTWWLGDLAGGLVITPVIVLWAQNGFCLRREALLETTAVIAAAGAVGVLAFSPLTGSMPNRDPLGFLAVLPLMWAALRCGQRDTATVALVLAGFAIWGALAGEGPFARSTLNQSLLLLIMYMISASVPTLALSADVAVRRQTERGLREAHAALNDLVQERTAALEETREALHQAQKMEALGRLTGGIAHDFNNVLTVVINSLEAARGSTGLAAKASERLDRALDGARHGASLVQQMLVFARRHPLRVQATDINAVVASAMTMFGRSCPESIEIHMDLAPDLHWAAADATQMQTALLNLAVNACDAMPAGGRLTVATRNLQGEDRPLADLPAGQHVCIVVTDTGEGMTPEVLERAAEPFFTTKEIGKGTGLGLSMVYGTIQQMGGRMEIDSRPGEGTAVRLILPVATQPRPEAAIEREPAPAVRALDGGPPLILYVEDDALVSLATRDLLSEAGYPVHSAPDAVRALQLLEQHREIDLMITDVGLPGMDGHQLAAEARRRRPDLKLLFLSGYDRSGALASSTDPRAAHLGKPYQESELLSVLRRLLGADAPR